MIPLPMRLWLQTATILPVCGSPAFWLTCLCWLPPCALRLGIKTRDDVIQMGIDKYNEECRSIVMR